MTLLKSSSRLEGENPQKILSDFPYNPKNLLTVFNPYILGDVSKGTYPQFITGYWGIFWENNTYFGIVQLILISALVFQVASIKNKSLKKNILLFCSLGFLGILLALGKFGPLHPVFSIPPISFFRVPSRFLIFTFLSSAILAAYSLEIISRKIRGRQLKIILLGIILILATLDIFKQWFNYPLLSKAKDLEAESKFMTEVSGESRFISIGNQEIWNDVFLKRGWRNQQEEYLFLKNFMDRNLNLLYDKNTFSAYAGMISRRSTYVENLLGNSLIATNGSLKITNAGQNLLDFSGVNFVITSKKLDSENWKQIDNISGDTTNILLYQNVTNEPKVFSVRDYEVATNIQSIAEIIASSDFNPKEKVILEKNPEFPKEKNSLTKIKLSITRYSRNYVHISADLENDSILVLSDSYYPGWKAKVDGAYKEILAANINSRAIIVPKGNHNVEFLYKPERLIPSVLISFTSTVLLAIFIIRYRSIKMNFH